MTDPAPVAEVAAAVRRAWRRRPVDWGSGGDETLCSTRQARRTPLTVGVDGRSGSGKTSLAEQLAHELADLGTTALVHLDDLYAGWQGLDEAPRRVRDQVCRPLARGEQAQFHRWDWERGGYRGEMVRLGRPQLLVIEGVGALARVLRPHLDLAVWLEAEPVARYDRAIGRDGELFRVHWQEWAEQEDRYLARDDPAAAAGIVLRT